MMKLPEQIKKIITDHHFEDSLLFVGVGLVCAVVCSVYAILFGKIEHFSSSLFHDHPLFLFLAAPLGLILSFLVVRIYAPGSSGSGIPQVMVCIEKSHQHLSSLFLRKTIIYVKMISSLVAVFIGAAIGREGPSLQISAAIAYNVGKFAKRFGMKVKEEQLLIAGAASGLAAAFNTPIGGIVYAIEELSREHVRTFRDVLLLSVVISGLTAQLINGNYLYLGYPQILKSISGGVFLSIVLVGLISGMSGALFSKILIRLITWRSQKTIRDQLFILACIGLFIGTVFYFFGERYLYSGKESINYVLFSNSEVSFTECLARIFMPILSSMTGIAGGIFAPSLSAGAVIGGLAADLLDPSMRTILGLTGMVGFLTGVTHTPITSFMLVLEMTDRHSAVFPMMVASIISSLGAHFITSNSFYEETVETIKKANAG